VLFEYVPVAFNCCVAPLKREGLEGVTEIDCSVVAVTVSVFDPEMVPDVAVIVVEPAATAVANPFEPDVLLMVATLVVDELQIAVDVRFWVLPLENVPVAVNCWVVPGAMFALAGVTAIDTSVAAVTVRVADPDSAPDVAVIVVEPAATAVANPFDPAVVLKVATPVLDELQAAVVVRFWVLPSEKDPVAVNCWVVPGARFAVAGVIASEMSVAGVTVIVIDPEIFPNVAFTFAVPEILPFACPGLPVVSTVATLVLDELQTTDAVRSLVVLSEYMPVAVNCRPVFTARDILLGVISIAVSLPLPCVDTWASSTPQPARLIIIRSADPRTAYTFVFDILVSSVLQEDHQAAKI
jgi:hypothetical protein